MIVQQIRNATLRVEYAGCRFLVDPFLGEKEVYPGLPGTMNEHLRNPRVDLVTPVEEILAVDAVIVTHTHPDHWDEAAVRFIPKNMPVFTQNFADAELISSQGFGDVRVLGRSVMFCGVELCRTDGAHGSPQALEVAGHILGEVCGVVFRHCEEKTLYVAGDTIWNEQVAQDIVRYRPDVIVLNAGDAQAPGLPGSMLMGLEGVGQVLQAAPDAVVIASHLEAVNHAMLGRAELRAFAKERGVMERLLVPEDGERLVFA